MAELPIQSGPSQVVEQAAEFEMANGPMVPINTAAKGVHKAWLGVVGRRQHPNRASNISARAEFTVSGTVSEDDGSNEDGTMPDLEAGGRSTVVPCLVTTGAPNPKDQLVRALLLVSYASLFVGVKAGLQQPAATGSFLARHHVAYYSFIVAILVAMPIEMATAFLLQRSNDRVLHTFAKVVKHVGILLVLTVSAVAGFEFSIKV